MIWSPPAPTTTTAASATESSSTSPRRSTPPQAIHLRLLNRSPRGGFAYIPGRVILFCRRLLRLDASAHTPPRHRPHALGPGTIKSRHFFSPHLVYSTHMRKMIYTFRTDRTSQRDSASCCFILESFAVQRSSNQGCLKKPLTWKMLPSTS